MSVDVSVIMGCYNSEKTLEEAVRSVLSQQFSGSFELIAVDDGSRDSTAAILRRLAALDPRLKVLTHEENRGGGAARNSAVQAARSDVLLAFDSDDVLGEGALHLMFDMLRSRSNLDGVLFDEQRTFNGTRKDRYEPFRYYIDSAPVELYAIFQGKKALIGNFMYRRSAFLKAGGYPEHHGFDTQGFCFRFLSNGLRARVAKGSYFWHRVNGPVASYFERAFASGRYNLNMYLVYEDVLERFSPAALGVIARSSVFRTSGFQSEGITSRLQELERCGTAVLKAEGDPPLDAGLAAFLQGVLALRAERHEQAASAFLSATTTGLSTPLLHFNLIRAALGLAGTPSACAIEASLEAVEKLRIRKLPSNRGWTLFDRGLVKAARMVLSAHGIDDPIS
jgi:glycosyltransferase involved in cell wall biosynthesis